MEWLDNNIVFWHWVVLGGVLILAEIFVPAFTLLWFGISALIIGMILPWIPMAVSTQVIIWAILSLVQVFIWFKWINKKINKKSLNSLSREAIVGQQGTVIDALNNKGIIRFTVPLLGSEEWPFRSESDVRVGDRVMVIDITGNDLLVKKA